MVQYAIEDGESLQPSVANARLLGSHGYGVQDGCAVTINTGTLGSGEATLSIGSGTPLVGGYTTPVSSGTVDIAVGDDQPRKDLVVYDPSADSGAGAFAVVEGTPEAQDPPGSTGLDAERPAPPTLVSSVNALSGSGDPLIPLGEVWVGATTTGITSEDLTNRRVHADVGFGTVSVGQKIEMTATGNPDGALDLRPNSDGSHYLWMMDSGGSSPVEYGAQLNPGGGNAYILRDVTNTQNLFYVNTDGSANFPAGDVTIGGGAVRSQSRGDYAVDAGQFSSIQAAVDYANSNGLMRVEIPPGTYSETVTPFGGLALVGAGAVKQAPIIDGGASPAIDATGLSNVLVRNLRVQSNNGGTANAYVTGGNARVENVWVNAAGNHGIYCDDVFTSVTGVRTLDGNIGGDPIHLGSNSLRCIVSNNLQTTIVNNGSNNVVSNNS